MVKNGLAGLALVAVLGIGAASWVVVHQGPQGHDHNEAAQHMWHGKPGAEISLANSGLVFLDVHEQRTLELALTTAMASGEIHFHIEADEGLVLVSAQTEWTFDLNEPRVFNLPIAIYGASEGKHYIHVFADHVDEYGRYTSRAMAQQIVVGSADEAAKHEYKATKSTAALEVVLPANETIY